MTDQTDMADGEKTQLSSEEIGEKLAEIGLVNPAKEAITSSQDQERSDAERERRRGFAQTLETGRSQIMLLKDPDGVLRWSQPGQMYQGRFTGRARGHARAGRAQVPAGTVAETYVFDKIQGENQVSEQVEKIDDKCTDPTKRDVFTLGEDLKFTTPVEKPEPGRFSGKTILLFIHGTFSHSDTTIDQMHAAGDSGDRFGQAFLKDARAAYDEVIAFNHPTLAVSPMVNAFRLAALLRDPDGGAGPKRVDVICHSRGGVVTRWWLEAFADPKMEARVVFFGSPLGGTSLASPSNIKSGLDILTNIGTMASKGAQMSGVPFLIAAAGIVKIFTSVTALVATGPVLDAVVSAFPGLMGQARIRQNFQLENLWWSGAWAHRRPGYHAITSDFEPPRLDKFKFWRVFYDRDSLKYGWWDSASDRLVFVDEDKNRLANDLIVDTASMTELGQVGDTDKAISKPFQFSKADQIHHMNYFSHAKSYAQMRQHFDFANL